LKIALAASKTFFVDGNPELVRDHVDVLDVEVDKRVGAGVTLVFREIEVDAPSREREEPRKPRLELVLPLLAESEPLVPRDSPSSVLDIQDRDHLFVHAGAEVI
jgi:hypothetical protein